MPMPPFIDMNNPFQRHPSVQTVTPYAAEQALQWYNTHKDDVMKDIEQPFRAFGFMNQTRMREGHSDGFGDCFFCTESIFLFGDQDYHALVRDMTVRYACENQNQLIPGVYLLRGADVSLVEHQLTIRELVQRSIDESELEVGDGEDHVEAWARHMSTVRLSFLSYLIWIGNHYLL